MQKHDTKYGLLVSRKLPRSATGFAISNGVLTVEPQLAASLAGILRNAILELARAHLPDEGKAAKTAGLYEYLRRDAFTNAMLRIKDKVQELSESLAKERSTTTRGGTHAPRITRRYFARPRA
jgi:hypothetical protein